MYQYSYSEQISDTDLGNLLYIDKNPISTSFEYNDQELITAARVCTSSFFQQLWKLPTKVIDNVTISELPTPSFQLPREKPCPMGKQITKWEQFARMKGIQKRKRSRMVWDEASQTYKPRYGYGRADDIKDKWCVEVPGNADPYEDQFQKMKSARSEKRAKNEMARLKNIKRSIKGGAAPVGVFSEALGTKQEITRALSIAQHSNASLGHHLESVKEHKVNKTVERRIKKKSKTLGAKGAKAIRKHGGKPLKKAKPFKKGSRTGK
ncbi:Rhodanese- sulfurtransferase [Cichlidogyrus casuarinus]|uniref:Ribosome biogenesis regulatory protein n=1 Tax=Cichlidogyrus casuarinus TaxID=1844966 RepID=A0ABD2QD19_9PLAT